MRVAFQTVLATDANAAEVEVSIAAMQEFRSLAAEPDSADTVSRSRVMLIQSLINHNDFVTIR